MKSLGLNPSDSDLQDMIDEVDIDGKRCVDRLANVQVYAPFVRACNDVSRGRMTRRNVNR